MLKDIVARKSALSAYGVIEIIAGDLNSFSMAVSAFENALMAQETGSNFTLFHQPIEMILLQQLAPLGPGFKERVDAAVKKAIQAYAM